MKRLLSLLFHDVYAADPAESGFAGPGAERYKLPLADFEHQLARLAGVLQAAPLLATAAPQPETGLPVAITVDDGGLSYYTQVADRLESRGWRGHCFVTTGWLGKPGFLHKRHLRELHERGHVIGSHSVTHPPRFAACKPEEMRREWRDSRAALEDLLGAEVRCASVPGGYHSAEVARAAREAGYTHLFTSEPETRVRASGPCRVLGRYAIRRGDPTDYPARLVSAPSARRGAWLRWNAKKLPKAVLGGGYPRLAARLGRHQQGI